MTFPRLRLPNSLGIALVALAVPVGLAACEADVESTCLAGECNEQEDPTTTTGSETTSSTASACVLSENGSDSCSDDPQDGDFPCEVFTILEAKCQTCHTDPHASGAPIDLLTCDRFHEQDCSGKYTRLRMADYYLCTDFMPLGAKKLTDEEKATLTSWLDQCAPCVPAGTGCSGTKGPSACYE